MRGDMLVTPIPFNIAEINVGHDTSPRTPGLHVSAVIRDIANRITKKGERPAWDTQTDEERLKGSTYQALGFAWERVLERALSEQYEQEHDFLVRPGEQYLDGIYLSPDPFDLRDGVLEEWKCTWKSSNKFADIEKFFWEWTVQIKSYLKALGLTQCRLRVYFVNGDYKDSGPQVKCAMLTFTQREIDENWRMITNHAKGMADGNSGSK